MAKQLELKHIPTLRAVIISLFNSLQRTVATKFVYISKIYLPTTQDFRSVHKLALISFPTQKFVRPPCWCYW